MGLALGGARADRPPGDRVGDVLRRDRVEELAADRKPGLEHPEQHAPREVQPGVDVAGAVEVRVVDQPLPAGRRARLLEVDAHRDAAARRSALPRELREPPGVLERRLGVVHAARARRPPAAGRRALPAPRGPRGGRGSPRRPARRSAAALRAARRARAAARRPRSACRGRSRLCAAGLREPQARARSLAAGPGDTRVPDPPAFSRPAPPPARPRARTRRTRRRAAAGGRRRSPRPGSGWTSTMIPSAPTAAAASDSGVTSSRRPAAWLGSTITGRCERSLSTGTAIRSSVKR